jgi:glutamate synthase (NADPH/NADH) small chain
MQNKNKQYRIEKGLLLFTQPKSPYFYGKIRVDGKYLTKSFAPITDLEIAKEKLYEWKESFSFTENINTNLQQQNLRDEYIEHKKLKMIFSFLKLEDLTQQKNPSKKERSAL